MSQQQAGRFILHRDGTDRILIWCSDCHDQMLVGDILDFQMHRSRWLGPLRAKLYTFKNMVRMTLFVRAHQHGGDEE